VPLTDIQTNNMTKVKSKRKGLTLWLGGTSSLARTYINEFGAESLILSGSREKPPLWVSNSIQHYVALDLLTVTESDVMGLARRFPDISSIIVGVRPLLFTPFVDPEIHRKMVQGVSLVIDIACRELGGLKFVLHLSSVAATDHLKSQHLWSETQPLTAISEYRFPYDVFKRRCEEEISDLCSKHDVLCCHLRLSALFSDDKECIQCSALDLQGRIGCYLPVAIDCNSSVNVSRAIDLLLARAEEPRVSNKASIRAIYYYTRPIHLTEPVPYGYYLQEFRRAYQIHAIWIPVWVVNIFVSLFHCLAVWNRYFGLPYIDAVDYLLQVSSR